MLCVFAFAWGRSAFCGLSLPANRQDRSGRGRHDFDWSEISPTIFGAVFESTLNPETRRSGGMHYTSIENIHKVIDPLFLDDLKAEFEEIKNIKETDEASCVAWLMKLYQEKVNEPK